MAGATTITLRDALARMSQSSLELAAARHDLSAARADVIAAGVLTNPNVAVNGQFLLFGAPAQGEQSFNVVVDQVIPLGGQVGLRKDVARGYASAAERDFAAVAWTLASAVRDAYLDLQTAQARVRLIGDSLRDLERVEGILAERARNGANPVYDSVRVQLERADVSAQLTAAQADLGQARVALAQAIGPGVDARTLAAEEPGEELPDAPTDLAALEASAVQRRSEIQAAKLRAQAADLRTTQIRREYFPSPDVQVGYSGWRGVPTDTGTRGGGSLYVGVSVPIPFFDHGQGKIDRAAAEASAARARAESAELGIRREVQRAAQTMTNQVTAYRTYRATALGQPERLRAMAEVSYREGRGTVMELLDAYRTNLTLKQRAIELRMNAWRATSDLERAVGPRPPPS